MDLRGSLCLIPFLLWTRRRGVPHTVLSSPVPRMQPGLWKYAFHCCCPSTFLLPCIRKRASNGSGAVGREPRPLSAHALPLSSPAKQPFWLGKPRFWLLAKRELVFSKFVSQAKSLELAEALHFQCQLLMI